MDDEIMTMSVTENPTEDMRGYIHYEGSNVYVEIYDRKCRENVSETLGSVKEVSGEYDIDKIDFNCHLYCNYQHTGTMPTELTTLRGCMIESVVYRTKKGAFWTAVQRLTACPYDENPSGKKPKVYTRTNYGYNTANAFSATNWSDWKCEDNAIEAEATARAAADEELKSDIGEFDSLTFEAENIVDAVNQAYARGGSSSASSSWSDNAIGFLETVLKNIAYTSETSGQAAASSLISALRSTSGSGSNTPSVYVSQNGTTLRLSNVTSVTSVNQVGNKLILS